MSDPGATASSDCYCNRNYYYLNYSDTCQLCPADGVNCPGGFDPPTSRLHTAPRSVVGSYMTGFADSQPCTIEDASGTGTSVCLAGATAANVAFTCSGDQTGMLCGACKHLTVRDLGDEACKPCDASYHDWMHIASLNIDLFLKAGFGIFLGKQAMLSAVKIKKMDAVILRILLQWITTCSVLSSFDLSQVSLYSWSKDKLIAKLAAEDVETATAESRATGLSFKFEFPDWFKPVWDTIMLVKGSIPGPLSPQVSMECLIQRQVPVASNDDPAPMAVLLAPALWWLVYPIFVVMYTAILCILLAKVAYPTTLWFVRRARGRLERLLLAAGVSALTASTAAKGLDHERVIEILEDPMALTSVKGLLEFFGQDAMAEAVSSFLVAKCGPRIMEKLEALVGSESLSTSITEALVTVIATGVDALGEFLIFLIKAIDPAKIEAVFSDPLSIPEVLLEFVESLDGAALEHFTRQKGGGVQDERQSFANIAAADTRRENAIPRRSNTDGYKVFGLFRNARLITVLTDAFPLYIVTMYSIWDVVTRRMLGLIQVKSLLVTVSTSDFGVESRAMEGRWLYDMRLHVLGGDHFWVGIIGVIGLLVWSIGFLFGLFVKLRRNRHHLQEKHMTRNFGYFYNGLEPNTYWWDVVAKKADILCLYFVTFTEVFHDPRAKLIMYLGFAGIFWAAHNMYHPFDDRQNQLADRLEGLGLATRFITLFVLQLLLMLNSAPTVNAVLAICLLILNAFFLLTVVFILIIEIPSDDGVESDSTGRVKGEMASKAKSMRFGRDGLAMKLCSMVFALLVRPFIGLVLKVGGAMSRAKNDIALTVPHIRWTGLGRDLIVVTHEHNAKERRPWYKRIFARIVTAIYRMGNDSQKEFTASLVGQFIDHVITNSEMQVIPGHILDIFFVLPGAIKEEKDEATFGDAPYHIKIARRVNAIFEAEMQKAAEKDNTAAQEPRNGARSTRSTVLRQAVKFNRHDLPSHAFSGEDLTAGLLFIRRLSGQEVSELMAECCKHVYYTRRLAPAASPVEEEQSSTTASGVLLLFDPEEAVAPPPCSKPVDQMLAPKTDHWSL